MIIENIKKAIVEAMKAGRKSEITIMKVALGDMQTIENRQGKITEEECVRVINKVIQANEESIKVVPPNHPKVNEIATILQAENEVLRRFLPLMWNEKEIETFINEQGLITQIKESKTEGQAMGVAIKALKAAKAPHQATDVKIIVERLRSA